MEIGPLIGTLGTVVGILGAVIAYTKHTAQSPLQARIAQLEGEVKRKQEANADLQGRLETETERERKQVAALQASYDELRQDFQNLKRGRGGVIIKNEIDSSMLRGMSLLRATESSVLVPGPPPSANFVFLSIFGPAAAKLRYSKLPIDKGKAGKVFATGRLDNSLDPRKDPDFHEGMDKKGSHTTRTLLTVPLAEDGRTVGVLQFLNKENDRGFTAQDESIAADLATELAGKVADFVRDTSNFELLGLAARQDEIEETIVFCDLSASSALFGVLHPLDAIDCINDYFQRQSEIAIAYGATVDKYMGDGIMFRFPPQDEGDRDHATRAVNAALRMTEDFEALKEGWRGFEYAVEDVYSRVGIATGPLREAILGHRQHQHITVIGETVNTAANLCEVGSRTRNVILISGSTHAALDQTFAVDELSEDLQRQLKSRSGPFYDLQIPRPTPG